MPDEGRARRGIARKEPAIPVGAPVERGHLCALGAWCGVLSPLGRDDPSPKASPFFATVGEVMMHGVHSRVGYVFMDRQISVCIEFNRQVRSKNHDILIMLTLKGGFGRPVAPCTIGNAFDQQASAAGELRYGRE